MDIVIAAEKPTIADLLSEYLRCPVNAQDITVWPNPGEIGSFLIKWRLNRYLLSPDGRLTLRAIRVDCMHKHPAGMRVNNVTADFKSKGQRASGTRTN